MNWRHRIKQIQLVSQISSILLQRRDWVALLRNLNLSSKLTQPIFFQILQKTQQNPKISLSFFNWARTSQGFEPDLKSLCRIIRFAMGSGLTEPARPIFDSLIQNYPASVAVDSLIRECEGTDSLSDSLSFVLDLYSQNCLCLEALEVFRKMRACNHTPPVYVCNSLLGALLRGNNIRLAWCFHGAMTRNNVSADRFTWSLLSQILCKDGKMETVVRLLDMGVAYDLEIYDVVIDYYSENGYFDAALSRFDEMRDKKINPGFSTYASMLDGVCKFKNATGIEKILSLMVEKRFTVKQGLSEKDSVIQGLCNLRKSYAAEMLFERACDEKESLQDATYGSMLVALSKGGRVKQAVSIYRMICRRGVAVDDSCYKAFVNALCEEDQSEEESELLRDVIKRGFLPDDSKLSKFLASHVVKRRWREAEELINLVLDVGFVPESLSCSSLVKHYCLSGPIGNAIALHCEIRKINGTLNVSTYNVLLDGLFREQKIEEAVDVFEYMKRLNSLDTKSFTIMVRGLCRAKEMRKAMKIHDEMLKTGMKPDAKSYKRLISGFK